MSETTKIQIDQYSMKMQLYPNAEQREIIDRMLRALHVAYNITFHEVFQKNDAVCTKPNKEGKVWPSYSKMASAKWRHRLIEINPIIEEAPSDSLLLIFGMFHADARNAWEKGMHNRPVDNAERKDFHFYNTNKPLRSFAVQTDAKRIKFSEINEKVIWIKLPKIKERIKARGFNRKLWFGENGALTFEEAVKSGQISDQITTRVSKDACGAYYVSLTFSAGEDRQLFLETKALPTERPPIGIDMGIKTVATMSNGDKIENKRFKSAKDHALRQLNKALSSRWGPSNIAFRDYRHQIRMENQHTADDDRKPLPEPSKRYLAAKKTKSLIERRITRQRDTYYHQQTALLIRQHSMIAVETLYVNNMLRNHKLAYALSDAAMSEFTSKLKYKANRMHVALTPIGVYEPSSQMCSNCGFINPDVKNLGIRSWTCPNCHVTHDRDVNAAKNILAIALKNGAVEDKEIKPEREKREAKANGSPKGRARGSPGVYPVIPERTNIVIKFSKELSSPCNARYTIVDRETGAVVDDANGAGFRSVANARNCYKAKVKWSEQNR